MRRKLLLPALAACTLLAISAPVSNAATLGKKLSQVSGAVKGLQKSITFLRQGETGVKAAIGSVDARVDTVVKTLAAITAGVPTIVDNLTKVGAGLQKLADNYGADEYGIVQVFTSPPGNFAGAQTAVSGCFYETGNIPDNVQDAMVSGQCLMSGVAAGSGIHFLAGIRSNEVDGTGASDPAGVAGIVAYRQMSAACAATPCAVLSGGGATSPSAAGQPPAVTIPTKSPPTSTTETSFPFAPISTDVLVDLSATQFTGTPAQPVLAATSNTIDFTIRFNDLTPADPNVKQ